MRIIRKVDQLREALLPLRDKGLTIGLVPTMGALHAGHRSLVERSVKENDVTVVSVFVNPTQFNNPNDLATYPRTEEADAALLERAGVDIAFIPSVQEIYPEKDNTQWDLGPVAEVMEGPMRPGHFNGVCQIVSRLFNYVNPHRAYFGEKDFQQIAVIRRMAQIMQSPIQIVACPIVREDDGLALSSRNVRLSKEQRAIAPHIHRVLAKSLDWKAQGLAPREVVDRVVAEINSQPGLEVEYYEIVDSITMQPIDQWPAEGETPAAGCVTVYCGDVRLIDNIKY
ncbi:MAG: pantoate--beta-alanine ligase [Bacteroidales bacterium]|nr:pantoate--beta-alanine ligase [Bacteroidales bacterium]